MRGFDLPMGFLFLTGLLHGSQLILGQDDVFLSGLGFQGFEPLAKRLQIVPEPDAANASRRDE